MCDYLTGLAEYYLHIAKVGKDPNIDPWGTPQFMDPASEKTLSNESEKTLFVR